MGAFLRDVLKLNAEARNFQVFGPRNRIQRLGACFEATDRVFTGEFLKTDDHLCRTGV